MVCKRATYVFGPFLQLPPYLVHGAADACRLDLGRHEVSERPHGFGLAGPRRESEVRDAIRERVHLKVCWST
jgi:hypothetical protein